MTGIFLLVVVGLWLWLSIATTRALLGRLQPRWWRWLVAFFVLVALLVAPVADEVVGGFQFRTMCERDAVLKIDAVKVRGRTLKRLWVESFPANSVLKIRRVQYQLLDASTDEELGTYATLSVWGGWLVRALGISDGNAPLLINPASCDPVRHSRIDEQYGFVLVRD
jgi:hypothetical protein